jgi:hypothetical protein
MEGIKKWRASYKLNTDPPHEPAGEELWGRRVGQRWKSVPSIHFCLWTPSHHPGSFKAEFQMVLT